jgi:hypothetical protein
MNAMRRAQILILLPTILTGLQMVWADDDLPTRPSFDRYKGMLDHSPFAVASAVIAPAAEPNFAKDLYVANAAKSPDGDMVTIASNADKEFKKYLTTKEPVDGYSIASIEWSDRVGETKVTISKDGQFATLQFNQALISQPMPRQPGLSSMPIPPPAAQPRPLGKPLGIPPSGTPIPHSRGIIQRNPAAAAQTPVPLPPQPPDTEE